MGFGPTRCTLTHPLSPALSRTRARAGEGKPWGTPPNPRQGAAPPAPSRWPGGDGGLALRGGARTSPPRSASPRAERGRPSHRGGFSPARWAGMMGLGPTPCALTHPLEAKPWGTPPTPRQGAAPPAPPRALTSPPRSPSPHAARGRRKAGGDGVWPYAGIASRAERPRNDSCQQTLKPSRGEFRFAQPHRMDYTSRESCGVGCVGDHPVAFAPHLLGAQ